MFQHNQLKTKMPFEIFDNLARFSPPSGEGTITEKNTQYDIINAGRLSIREVT